MKGDSMKKDKVQMAQCLPFWSAGEWDEYAASVQRKVLGLRRPAGTLAQVVLLTPGQWSQYLRWKANILGFPFPKKDAFGPKSQFRSVLLPRLGKHRNIVPVGSMETWEAFLSGWAYAAIGRDLDWQECPALRRLACGLKRT